MVESAVVHVSERAQMALSASPIFAMRDLRVERTGNSLLILGSVATYYHKQLAQELVRSVARDVEVINSVTVE